MATSMLTLDRVTWTNIVAVDKQDSKLLRAAHPGFPPFDLANPLTCIARPEIDEYDDHLFAVMQFPIRDAARRIRGAAEVNLSIGEGSLENPHAFIGVLLMMLFIMLAMPAVFKRKNRL